MKNLITEIKMFLPEVVKKMKINDLLEVGIINSVFAIKGSLYVNKTTLNGFLSAISKEQIEAAKTLSNEEGRDMPLHRQIENSLSSCPYCKSEMKVIDRSVHLIVSPPQIWTHLHCEVCNKSVQYRIEDDYLNKAIIVSRLN